jgi:hypothetical protein
MRVTDPVCVECNMSHVESKKCEGCGKCLYANVARQVPDDYWCIVECKCGKRQVWD